MWVRFVLVPGWTDYGGDITALARFTASLGNVEQVDVLPFHALGAAKYAALGLDYPCAGVAPPTAEQISQARALSPRSACTRSDQPAGLLGRADGRCAPVADPVRGKRELSADSMGLRVGVRGADHRRASRPLDAGQSAPHRGVPAGTAVAVAGWPWAPARRHGDGRGT